MQATRGPLVNIVESIESKQGKRIYCPEPPMLEGSATATGDSDGYVRWVKKVLMRDMLNYHFYFRNQNQYYLIVIMRRFQDIVQRVDNLMHIAQPAIFREALFTHFSIQSFHVMFVGREKLTHVRQHIGATKQIHNSLVVVATEPREYVYKATFPFP